MADWADIHLYHRLESIPDKVAWVRARWHGPLAATEFGGPDTSTGIPYTEARHAQELPQRFDLGLQAGLDRIFWSFLRDMDIEGDHLAQTLGLMALDWRKKPAYNVYRDLIAAAVTSVSEDPVPAEFSLSQNHPNPFNPETKIRDRLAAVGNVELTIFDITGRHVRTLVHGAQNAGSHTAVWDGRDYRGKEVASGIYLYRLSVGKRVQTRRMVLLR
ncbi:MAG: FlgD immunoglobulin-like domain containing protein [bacterium]